MSNLQTLIKNYWLQTKLEDPERQEFLPILGTPSITNFTFWYDGDETRAFTVGIYSVDDEGILTKIIEDNGSGVLVPLQADILDESTGIINSVNYTDCKVTLTWANAFWSALVHNPVIKFNIYSQDQEEHIELRGWLTEVLQDYKTEELDAQTNYYKPDLIPSHLLETFAKDHNWTLDRSYSTDESYLRKQLKYLYDLYKSKRVLDGILFGATIINKTTTIYNLLCVKGNDLVETAANYNDYSKLVRMGTDEILSYQTPVTGLTWTKTASSLAVVTENGHTHQNGDIVDVVGSLLPLQIPIGSYTVSAVTLNTFSIDSGVVGTTSGTVDINLASQIEAIFTSLYANEEFFPTKHYLVEMKLTSLNPDGSLLSYKDIDTLRFYSLNTKSKTQYPHFSAELGVYGITDLPGQVVQDGSVISYKLSPGEAALSIEDYTNVTTAPASVVFATQTVSQSITGPGAWMMIPIRFNSGNRMNSGVVMNMDTPDYGNYIKTLKLGNDYHTVIDDSLTNLKSPFATTSSLTFASDATYVCFSALIKISEANAQQIKEIGLFNAQDELCFYIKNPPIDKRDFYTINIRIKIKMTA